MRAARGLPFGSVKNMTFLIIPPDEEK